MREAASFASPQRPRETHYALLWGFRFHYSVLLGYGSSPKINGPVPEHNFYLQKRIWHGTLMQLPK
jgi:hypothetical protein